MNLQHSNDTLQNGKQKTGTVQKIEQRYLDKEYYSQLEDEKRLLDASFAEVERRRKSLESVYAALEQCYTDAQVVYASEEIEPERKKKLLYRIYDAYYEKLASLSLRKRMAIHADKHIRKMHRSIKRGRESTDLIRYWVRFAKLCLPPLIVGLIGEIAFINVLDTEAPIWQVLLSFAVFLLGFGGYMILVYEIEGQRLYSDLKKWISYKISPEEQDRPMDFLQYIKMAIPLVVALLSALVKLYFK